MLPSPFQRLTVDEVQRASNSPGLYAWYGTVVAGAPDWEEDMQRGKDQGEVNSRRLIKSHTSRYKGPHLQVRAVSGFSAVWEESIEDRSNQELQEILSGVEYTESDSDEEENAYRPVPKLQQTLSNPDTRKLLFKALGTCSPVFSAPLYIGVAKDLKSRLHQHTRMLFKLWDIYSRDPAKFDRVLQNKQFKGQFAVRAVQRGFAPETVEVWTFPLDTLNEDKLNTEELRTTAEAIEWLLNRWHRPPLGRR